MKIKDREFIREIVASDFKHISNPDFTPDILKKIAELEVNKINYSYSGDVFFIVPLLIYVFLFFLYSLISVFIPQQAQISQTHTFLYAFEMVSGFITHPVTISILLSFSLLYLFDLCLKKLSAKNNKHQQIRV